MSLSWTTECDCYRARIKVSYPETVMVYHTNVTMAQACTEPSLSWHRDWGDISSAHVIVAGVEGDFVLIGAVTSHRSLTMFRAVFESRNLTGIEMWQPEIKPDETPEETVILQGSDWRALLKQYADIAAAKMGVKPIDATKNVTGYCTWYYYYEHVSEQNTLDNIDALAANREPYAAEYVQIDDGYQTFQGDWLDQNENWPTPLPVIAKKILDSGMKAGIWTMPATASTASRVFREHPDWFVKNEKGEPAVLKGWSAPPNDMWACLDATNPAVREHIATIFKTFRSWGFTYFKMDGLVFGLQKGTHVDPNATSVSAYRLLLKTIRDAVPDCILLGCTAPFLQTLGLVDNCRVSNDTSRYFDWNADAKNGPVVMGNSIAAAFRLSLANFWMFDRWFRADPDVIMARQDNAFYTRNQAKISVLSGIMTGVSLTSDHLGTISKERNALLAKAQNIRMRDVQPQSWAANEWPMTFEGTVDGKRAVAVVNDTKQIRTWKMDALQMPEYCYDLLDDKVVFDEITLEGGDAVLLIGK